MSGFSEQWLSLREPIDHASRSMSVQQAMLDDLRQRHGQSLSSLRVMDLGCGSGSNLRALAPLFGNEQHWTLVDHDPALLFAAGRALKRWADEVVAVSDQELHLRKGAAMLTVSFHRADLEADIEALMAMPHDLVTASALFDLVSQQWIERLCAQLASPLYAVLSFDGQMSWEPNHWLDRQVEDYFSRHQQQDKGLGVALGPQAGGCLQQVLRARGFSVTSGKSPWQIRGLPCEFYHLLMQGIARAVVEAGLSEVEVNDWLSFHAQTQCCVVGHDDLYASSPVVRA